MRRLHYIFHMKKALIATAFVYVGSLPASAAIVYLDLQNVSVPNTVEGIYINIVTGATTSSFPVDFNEAPWINLYLGGSGISNSDLLRPWASQEPGVYDGATDGNYFLNVAPGTLIDASGVFVAGESNSEFHMGLGSNQFQSGVQGYLAFAYEDMVGGSTSYGWFSFTPNAEGEGYSVDVAYSDVPGEALSVAAAVIPEPSTYTMLAGGLALGLTVLRRRKI